MTLIKIKYLRTMHISHICAFLIDVALVKRYTTFIKCRKVRQ